MKIQEQTSYSIRVYSAGEPGAMKVVSIPVGTFAGTQEKLFLVQHGELHAFDTGNQGGGQN
jgi:hypothetical protein